MKALKFFYLIGLLLVGTLLIASACWAQSEPETRAPVITKSYAQDKGRYGTVWKIYIEAEDTDADMDYVIVMVDQPGVDRYPPDHILLDPEHRNHLKGFLQWNTHSSKGAALQEGTRITLRVSIIDKARNKSNEVVLPYTFVSEASSQDELRDPIDEATIPRLGYISIELIGPDSDRR